METSFYIDPHYKGPMIVQSMLQKLKSKEAIGRIFSKFVKRWFVLNLNSRKFYYTAGKNKKKQIKTHDVSEIISIDPNPKIDVICDWKFAFEISTRDKVYLLYSESVSCHNDWCHAVRAVLRPETQVQPFDPGYDQRAPVRMASESQEPQQPMFANVGLREIVTQTPQHQQIYQGADQSGGQPLPRPKLEQHIPVQLPKEEIQQPRQEIPENKGQYPRYIDRTYYQPALPVYKSQQAGIQNFQKPPQMEPKAPIYSQAEVIQTDGPVAHVQVFNQGIGMKEDLHQIQRKKIQDPLPVQRLQQPVQETIPKVQNTRFEPTQHVPAASIKEFNAGIADFMSDIENLGLDSGEITYPQPKQQRPPSQQKPLPRPAQETGGNQQSWGVQQEKVQYQQRPVQYQEVPQNYQKSQQYQERPVSYQERPESFQRPQYQEASKAVQRPPSQGYSQQNQLGVQGGDPHFKAGSQGTTGQSSWSQSANVGSFKEVDGWGNEREVRPQVQMRPQVYKEQTMKELNPQGQDMDWDSWDD